MFGVFTRRNLLAVSLIVILAIVAGLLWQSFASASPGEINNRAKAWLVMQYHRIEDSSVAAATYEQANEYYITPDKNSRFSDCLGGAGQLRAPVGHLATDTADGHIQIGGVNGGQKNNAQDCLENRKETIAPVANWLGYTSGLDFHLALGYSQPNDGSGAIVGGIDKSKLPTALFEQNDFWGNLPRGNFGSGTAPDFVKYAILLDSLSHCGPRDGLYANAASGPGADSLWLYDVSTSEVGLFAVQVADDGRKITIGRGVGVGEDGEGKLRCGNIKQALMNKSLAEEYKMALGEVAALANTGGADPDGTGGDDEGKPTCLVDGVGWLVCPVSRFLAMINDQAYGIVSELMQYDVLTTRGNNGEGFDNLFNQWSTMRNIANAVFVVIFLIVIFSQMANIGLNTYTIKKMLPRIIVSALLVNLSFWVCALAVDFSNILGEGLYDLLKGMASSSTNTSGVSGQWEEVMSLILAGGVIAGGVGVAVIASGSMYAALAFALPLLIGALFAMLIAIVVLVARQAIITILIIVAPIAFALNMLPSMGKWFDKWKTLFTTMLIMYPILGIVFGGSELASAAIRVTDDGPIMQIASLAIQALPLAFTYIIAKSSNNIFGSLTGMANDKTKGVFDRMGNAGKSSLNRRSKISQAKRFGQTGEMLNTDGKVWGKANSKRRKARAWVTGGSEFRQADAKFKDSVADQMVGDNFRNVNADRMSQEDYAKAVAGGDTRMADLLRAQATQQQEDEEIRMKKAYTSELSGLNRDNVAEAAGLAGVTITDGMVSISNIGDLQASLGSGNEVKIAAALDELGQRLDTKEYAKLAEAVLQEQHVKVGGNALTRSIADTAGSKGLISAGSKDSIATNNYGSSDSLSSMTQQNAMAGGFSPEKLAGLSRQDLTYLDQVTAGNSAARSKLKTAADTVLSDDILSRKVGKQQNELINMRDTY